jgi:hypothetical protein
VRIGFGEVVLGEKGFESESVIWTDNFVEKIRV